MGETYGRGGIRHIAILCRLFNTDVGYLVKEKKKGPRVPREPVRLLYSREGL